MNSQPFAEELEGFEFWTNCISCHDISSTLPAVKPNCTRGKEHETTCSPQRAMKYDERIQVALLLTQLCIHYIFICTLYVFLVMT